MVVEVEDFEDILSQFERVFESSLGEAKEYMHNIKLKKGTKQVNHVVKKGPLAVRAKMKEMLQQMIEDKVIKLVEAMEWLSPVVVMRNLMDRSGSVSTYTASMRTLS
ncbi:hypothetical protein NDU88_006155 [Pleurodeles waltl]|uniref:Uncharacterized protein n=1 Tax=Pleurodeles waltl TaxID=8319 RepID=A0AAV7UK69_PLEWA|nr:hypothetical protein NDU88_006155 [Pleurodeles waltl]